MFYKKIIAAYRTIKYPNYWDFLALLLLFTVFIFFSWNASQMAIPFEIGQAMPISLDPAKLPAYAARSLMRMLIAMFFSILATFIFGTLAAKSRRAERIIIPMIDILQSVPILGFLSVTVTGFITFFPGSLLGPESAVIFAVFTSQVWNMIFGFYQTIKSVPVDIQEAATLFQISVWQRFWLVELPFSIPGLLWNIMMSMSGGWFFIVAAEAITVSKQKIILPGVGSYIATAIDAANMHAIFYAIVTILVVILAYDQLLFHPLIAWSEKFKMEQLGAEKKSTSWVLSLFQHSRLMHLLWIKMDQLSDRLVNLRIFLHSMHSKNTTLKNVANIKIFHVFWNVCLVGISIILFSIISRYIAKNIAFSEITQVFLLGLITASRVFILILISSLIWVPLGIWIGLRPRASQFAEPTAQFLAAFPANLLYPFIVIPIAFYHLNPNIWLTPLMILGAQWYILFNVIAGTSVIPKDLLQVTDIFGVKGWLRLTRLILPAIFPYYVTGALTAAGGAWNASIVAEVASWGNIKLTANGLGAYIAQCTDAGDFPRIILGVGSMCLLIVIFNHLIWRPLYRYAVNHYTLE